MPVILAVTLADRAERTITLSATRNHPFSVRTKGFVPAGGLALGNAIVTRAGPDLRVAKIEWRRRAEGWRVYNFEVAGNHTYFVGKAGGGAWVHNPNACPFDLVATHGQTHSKRVMQRLTDDIASNGIREPLKVVEHLGRRYVVDGHHRRVAAIRLGLTEVPYDLVELPFLGYRSVEDLFIR